MKKVFTLLVALAMVFALGACSLDSIRYAGGTDKEVQTAECIVVETVEEAAEVVEAASEVEAPEPVVVVKKVVKIRQPIMFPFDSSEITDAEMVKVDTLANLLTENPDTNVVINGFASSEGPEDYNQSLSEERAVAVQSALIGKGIADDRIDVVGKGETGIFGELLKLNRRAIVLDVE